MNGKNVFKKDFEAILKLHELKKLQQKVKEENHWIKCIDSVKIPKEGKAVNYTLLCEFQQLLMNGIDGVCVSNDNPRLLTSDISLLTKGGWINLELMEQFSTFINNIRSHNKVVTLASLKEYEKSGQLNTLVRTWFNNGVKTISIIVNVGKGQNGKPFAAVDSTRGNHWTCLCLDIYSMVWLYGDSLGWSFPENIPSILKVFCQILGCVYQFDLSFKSLT